MLAVIIPTLNAAEEIVPLLEQLNGRVDRLVIADGGSKDETLQLAIRAGAVIAAGEAGRGQQVRRGASWATEADWYLFVHADCLLPENWRAVTGDHIIRFPESAAYFAFGAKGDGIRARLLECFVRLRHIWPGMPYGDQGLLISRRHYNQIGGYPSQALFEDVKIIEQIWKAGGRQSLRKLPARIKTDISAHLQQGIFRRGWRNLRLFLAYRRGVPLEKLIRRYKADP